MLAPLNRVYRLDCTNLFSSASMKIAVDPHCSFFGSTSNCTPFDLSTFAVEYVLSQERYRVKLAHVVFLCLLGVQSPCAVCAGGLLIYLHRCLSLIGVPVVSS